MTTRIVSNGSINEGKVSVLSDILSLMKPRLSALVIFTSALGLFLAPGFISPLTAIISIASTSGLVAGACAINCWMEKDIDALMERTKNRPLPSGRMSPAFALSIGISLVILCLATLFAYVNLLTGTLGLVATIVYVFLYTPMKKITSWALFAGAILLASSLFGNCLIFYPSPCITLGTTTTLILKFSPLKLVFVIRFTRLLFILLVFF